jgi:hypothetical protein
MEMSDKPEWDAFISHASEDKEKFVRPLAEALVSMGAKIWYDEFTLRPGDSLSASIDKGLARSRFGVVVISSHFMSKPWTQHELRGLVTREIGGRSRIIPIWHNVTQSQVSDFSPTLADKIAVRTSDADAIAIALQVLNEIRPDLYGAQPRAALTKLANGEAIEELQDELTSLREKLSEFQCPYCSSDLVSAVDAPLDMEEKHWDQVRSFACGFQNFGGAKQRLCPRDPQFPSFDEYNLMTNKQDSRSGTWWMCEALPQTDSARLVPLRTTFGPTREKAEAEMKEEYDSCAKPWMRPINDPY